MCVCVCVCVFVCKTITQKKMHIIDFYLSNALKIYFNLDNKAIYSLVQN